MTNDHRQIKKKGGVEYVVQVKCMILRKVQIAERDTGHGSALVRAVSGTGKNLRNYSEVRNEG